MPRAKGTTGIKASALTLLKAEGRPLSAYEVLDALSGEGKRLAPTTIYRALTALVEAGQVHRLESRNAFVACKCEGQTHAAILAICDDCGAVEETVSPEVLDAVSNASRKTGFAPSRHVIEVIGQCASCAASEA